MKLSDFLKCKYDPIYYQSSPMWDFLVPIHRFDEPDDWDGKIMDSHSNWRPYHDDWPFLKKTPRTATSFIFLDSELLEGNTTHWFEWKGKKHPKPWCRIGENQKTLVKYQDPVTGAICEGIYKSWPVKDNLSARIGVRISDELENGPGYVYVNVVPVPFFDSVLTFGTKFLK